jgi:hypothetical protein
VAALEEDGQVLPGVHRGRGRCRGNRFCHGSHRGEVDVPSTHVRATGAKSAENMLGDDGGDVIGRVAGYWVGDDGDDVSDTSRWT